jgi:hypothetical protein
VKKASEKMREAFEKYWDGVWNWPGGRKIFYAGYRAAIRASKRKHPKPKERSK